MLGLSIALLVSSDFTVDEPRTRIFGDVVYSEAICEDRKQRFCEGKDSRVGISAPPFFIYDFGGELVIIQKNEKCVGRYYASYDDIRSKKALWKLLSGERGCRKAHGGDLGNASAQLDDIYAAVRHMKERAAFVFGPIEARCKVKRDKAGWPISSTCI